MHRGAPVATDSLIELTKGDPLPGTMQGLFPARLAATGLGLGGVCSFQRAPNTTLITYRNKGWIT